MCRKVKVLHFINPDMNGIGVSPICGSILVHVLPGWDGGIFNPANAWPELPLFSYVGSSSDVLGSTRGVVPGTF